MMTLTEAPTTLASAKILVAGGAGAGKSTFVDTITEIPSIRAHQTTPLARDFGRITVDKSLRLYLFGTPPQDRYGFMWDQIAVGALGAVVLVDADRLADSFSSIDYFESRGLPFVVALNQFAGASMPRVRAVRTALDLDPDIAVLEVDARRREQVKKTLLELLDIVLYRALAAG